ncbi:hypothetical protein EW145_g6024 [Phellinidium pouzarii]|uniref:F-box domain-containing protein n=1 Tax=Phellinidium pouzarii TaxID=167371 RepID=A0A4S4KY33_9AGAM|nr:hypothetical protein EW145_g6024 [Phellinidium pouzarii]
MKNSFSAFEPGSGTSTPFPSAADALVARLRLDCGLGVPTINIFLDILHHPLFKLEELTVRDAANIDLAVAAHHGDLQRIRERTMAVSFLTTTSNTPLCLCSFAEIPYPILERILDAIATDVDLLDEAVQYQVPLVNIAGRRSDCLRTLALVHRSWTVPSQQRLAARIVARTPSALLRLLRSPLPGRHTEELIVALGDVWNNGYHYDGTNRDAPARPGDVESDLCNLLKRLPRLKSFMLKESGLLEDMILPEVSKLVSLQSLSWHCAHGYPSCDFTHLVEALRSLPNLSSLEISGWSFHAASGIICGAPLRQQLKELRICVSPGDMQLDRVGWLLQALAVDERGTKLILDITLIGTLSMTEVFRLFPDARLALGRLDTLHIINKGGFVEFNLAQARTLLQACSSVRHLHIQGQTAPISEFLDILPPTLEELCFSWSDMWKSPWNLVEIHLPGLIQSGELDELRRVVVFNYEIPFYSRYCRGRWRIAFTSLSENTEMLRRAKY